MSAGSSQKSEPNDERPEDEPRRGLLVASLALVFEAAAVLLCVWAVVYLRLATFGLVEVIGFVAFLALGYYYARKRGAFDRI